MESGWTNRLANDCQGGAGKRKPPSAQMTHSQTREWQSLKNIYTQNSKTTVITSHCLKEPSNVWFGSLSSLAEKISYCFSKAFPKGQLSVVGGAVLFICFVSACTLTNRSFFCLFQQTWFFAAEVSLGSAQKELCGGKRKSRHEPRVESLLCYVKQP